MKLPQLRAHWLTPQAVTCLLAVLLVCGVIGCGSGGGGGTSGGGDGTQPEDFALSVSPSSLSLNAGGTASFQVSVTSSNGFAGAVSLSLAGLPSGVSSTPASPQASPGSPVKITVSAGSTIAASSSTLTVSGVSGSLSHTATLMLSVQAGTTTASLSRTRYVRTDMVTEYPYVLNDSWEIFNSNTQRFFVSDPWGNQIVAMDAKTEKEIASIPVPGAFGIDQTPDGTLLYAGTLQGDIYAIDPVAMTVTHRYLSSQIGPYGYFAGGVRVLASGKLALLDGSGNSIDGFGGFAVWNPSDNSIIQYGSGVGGSSVPNCVRNIGAFTLTGDRSLIVEGSIDSDGTLCTVDPATGQQTEVSSGREFLYAVTPTPDGKSLLIPDYTTGGSILVLDAHTLTQTSSFPVVADTSSAASMIVSADSKTLYIYGGGIVYAYDIASGKLIGWTPYLSVMNTSSGYVVGSMLGPEMQAIDNTGLIAGPVEEGVGFIDTTALQTGPVGTQFLNGYVTPATGPASGGTAVQWNGASSSAPVQAYFGNTPVSNLSVASGGNFSATTPQGPPGPVDIYTLMQDGGEQIIPEGFSYGPTILQASPDASTAEGGGTGILFGYGFGSTADNAPIPTGLTITVGGQQATITGYSGNAYGLLSPPFPLEALAYTIPSGTAGASADIEVQSDSGSATLAEGMHYLPAVQTYALPGAQLAQGIYDAKRDLYYFTDAQEIQVFSLTQGKWLSPIIVPAAPMGTTHRLWGIALSPDGSKLAVSDANAAMIYVIDPDNSTSVQSFSVAVTCVAGNCTPSTASSGVIANPSGLAISDQGMVYYVAFYVGGDGYDGFLKLDTSSGKITDYGVNSFATSPMYHVAISSDNARVFFNNDGEPFSVDTATDTVMYALVAPSCCYGDYDLSLSSNQTQIEATSILYDTNWNAEAYLSLNDREVLYLSYVYGAKMSPDGSLLFQPSTNGIDVFDGRVGTLRTRIALPFGLSQNYDALVSDGTDNILVAITDATGDGVAVIDLSGLSEPGPLPYFKRGAAPLSYAWQEQASHPSKAFGSRAPSLPSPGANMPILKVPHASGFSMPIALKKCCAKISFPQLRSSPQK